MKIKKELCLLLLLLPLTTRADDFTYSISNRDCPPCGQVYTDVTMTPSENYAPVLPCVNYAASVERLRRVGCFEGFYVGTAFGIGGVTNNLEVNNVEPFQLRGDSKSYSVIRFDAGYAFTYCQFYLALEVGYNYRSAVRPARYTDTVSFTQTALIDDVGIVLAQATTTPCDIHIDLNSRHAGTVDLLPGFLFSRCFLGYLRLGVEKSQYTWTRRVCIPDVSFIIGDTTLTGTVFDQEFVDSDKKTTTGYRVGLGLAYAVTCHVSFNINFVYTIGEDLSFTPNVTNIASSVPTIPGFPGLTVTRDLSFLAARNTIRTDRYEGALGVTFTF